MRIIWIIPQLGFEAREKNVNMQTHTQIKVIDSYR